ncbi:isoleucyl-tRNA synthetase [Pedobacter polaris]|uniref:Isoleucyl-tRNA synthetase n=1 Tax=Pedobacter polaris TaxID=2571273 RepID=A0A4U1CTP2_9SPHI|nr:isoleucyl-tRNA synthetase [Pedobacter polaris]TKC12164.1 isoleucyl-tRNA synthetase [Pedobacter polaris]
MIKVLKLQKAVLAIILGIVALVIAQIMSSNRVTGSSYVLGLSGFLLIIGALMFLYPILFAKKVDNEGEDVELKPIAKTPTEEPDLEGSKTL